MHTDSPKAAPEARPSAAGKLLIALAFLLPAPALAGLCIHDEDLDPLVGRFADGSTTRATLQVWEGDSCDRPVPPAAKLANPQVEVFFRAGEDPRKRTKEEQKQAEDATKAIEVRGVGGKVELRLLDRSKLFVDPRNPTATFIYRLRVSRLEVSSAAGSAMDLDTAAVSPCRSIIRLTSRLSKTPLQLTADKYQVTSDPSASELATVGTLDLKGLLGPEHAAQPFDWAAGTGRAVAAHHAAGGRPGGPPDGVGPADEHARPPRPCRPRGEGRRWSTRVRLGYPLVGVGVIRPRLARSSWVGGHVL
ncbi:MAG: hypothetical protein R3F43_04270 [bacterium]